MNTRPRALELVSSTILAGAAIVGVLAAIQPLIAVGVVGAIVLAYVVFNDLAMGFAVLAFVSFLDTLPTSGALSLAKGASISSRWRGWRLRHGPKRRGRLLLRGSLLTSILIAFFGLATLSLQCPPTSA